MRAKGDRSKLPKWAQSEIERLERDVAHWKSVVAQGPENSDTFADPYAAVPRPLGEGTTIEFRFGEGHNARIRVRREKDAIYVLGGDGIAVFPQSSNTLLIKCERWR